MDDTDSLRDRAMVFLLFDSELRSSELASIQSTNKDSRSNTLRVAVKGNREARAAFSCNTAMLLKEHLSNSGHNPALSRMKPRDIQDRLSRLSA